MSAAYSKQDIARCYQTLLEMMRDRGVPTDRLERFQGTELDAALAAQPVFSAPITDDMTLVVNLNPKVRYSDLRKLLDGLGPDVRHVILVFREPLSTQNAKALAENPVGQIARTEVFQLRELLYNVSHHELVPKHARVESEDEVKQVLAAYKLKSKAQLPLILKGDPMARYLGIRTGEVVRITRPSPTGGTYVCYRCCV
jgi:DNA-directed RNA polymerase subunit H (RpoH/RPB5)